MTRRPLRTTMISLARGRARRAVRHGNSSRSARRSRLACATRSCASSAAERRRPRRPADEEHREPDGDRRSVLGAQIYGRQLVGDADRRHDVDAQGHRRHVHLEVSYATRRRRRRSPATSATASRRRRTRRARRRWSVEQSFSTTADEQLYGGGEFQNGLVGIKGVPLQLVQFNTEAAVPLASTKGYGLLWDSNAWTMWNLLDASDELTFLAAASPSSRNFDDGTALRLGDCDAGAWGTAGSRPARRRRAHRAQVELGSPAARPRLRRLRRRPRAAPVARRRSFGGNQHWELVNASGGVVPTWLVRSKAHGCCLAAAAAQRRARPARW